MAHTSVKKQSDHYGGRRNPPVLLAPEIIEAFSAGVPTADKSFPKPTDLTLPNVLELRLRTFPNTILRTKCTSASGHSDLDRICEITLAGMQSVEAERRAERSAKHSYDGQIMSVAAPYFGLAYQVIALRDLMRNGDAIFVKDGAPFIPDYPYILIDPEIGTESNKTRTEVENCIAMPHLSFEIERPHEITGIACDRQGDVIEFTFKGWFARAALVAIDQLSGTMPYERCKNPQHNIALAEYTMKNYSGAMKDWFGIAVAP